MADEPSETPAPLSDAEIAEIVERAARATPGPWRGLYLDDGRLTGVRNDSGAIGIGEQTLTDADVAFITAARTDIPRLLATLAALRSPRLDGTEQYMLEEIRDPARGTAFLHALLEAHGRDLLTLEHQNAEMREVTAAVAGADNSDSSVCYQVCHYRLKGEGMRLVHTVPCVVELARAVLSQATS